jgi:hypothetical protein
VKRVERKELEAVEKTFNVLRRFDTKTTVVLKRAAYARANVLKSR